MTDPGEAFETMLDADAHPLARTGAAFALLRDADRAGQDYYGPGGLSWRSTRKACLQVLDTLAACV